MRRIVFIQGGGIGFDQEQSVRRILSAADVAIDWLIFPAGWAATSQGLPILPEEMLRAVRETGIALKTKLLAPSSGSSTYGQPANANVLFRRALGLFASVRPVHNLAGLPSRFEGIDFLLVREITEDLYASSEHEIVPGVVQSFKIVTEAACLHFFRFAFELAMRDGRTSIHCIHKANILKVADGLYLDCFRRVAGDFQNIEAKEMIVDNCCMQLVSRPQQFEMLAAGNLYGDLLGDLGAGLVGGISATSAINHGAGIRVYEAVYGGAREMIGPDRANPLPLLLPALAMLKDIGESVAAARIHSAVESVLKRAVMRTADLGGSAGTMEFTQLIIDALA
jgi:isocitrate dehydrogenase (NAD+)